MAQIAYQQENLLYQRPLTATAADSSLACRNRFISTYKIKKLGRPTAVDRALATQSHATDWADCKLDAALYTRKPRLHSRTDVEVYISLYGLTPHVVQKINYAPTIILLNLCATAIAAENHTPTNGFRLQFMVFLNAFEESGYKGGYLEDDASPVRTEHLQLLHALDREAQVKNLPTTTTIDMAIDANIPTTTPAMDQHTNTNLFQENKSLQQKNQILYQQVELLTKLHQVRQEGLLHQSQGQNAESEDSAMKDDQPASELKHESEKQLEEGLKQEEAKLDDSDVTLGRDVGGEDEQDNGGQDKGVDQDKDDDKMDEDEEEEEEEECSYDNSEASDYEGPESWDGDSLGGDPEASDPEKDDNDDEEEEDETMEDDNKGQKWPPWSTGKSEDKGPEEYQSRQTRNNFIASYKIHHLKNGTAEDRKLVSGPGASSSLGECKLDSWLYFNNGFEEEIRKDFNAYKSLYGFHPAILDFIEYKPTLRLLDRHAEKVASMGYTPKQEFHDRFREFVEAFEKADYPSDYLEGDLSSEVARAHMAFCEALDSC